MHHHKRRFSLSSILTVSALLALPLGAASIINGSFENLGSYVLTPSTDSMTGAAADGWAVSSNSPDWFLGAPGPSGLWSTPWGDFFAVGAAEGAGYREGFSQTITGLTVGESYLLEFEQANGLSFDQVNYLGAGTVGGWEVLLDGISILSSNSVNDNSTPAPAFTSAWSSSSVAFAATSTSQTLEFLAYGGTASNPTFQFVDNVTINPVPEPSTAMLAALGGWAFLARRKCRVGR